MMEGCSVYAVIESGGKQYRVEVGQHFDVELLPVEPGASVILDRVILLSDDNAIRIGQPTVEGASVSATVVHHGQKAKSLIFKMRPKQRYRVKRGFRQQYTRLHVDAIKQ